MVTTCVGIATAKLICSGADIDSEEGGCSHVIAVADWAPLSAGGLRPAAQNHSDPVPEQEAAGSAAGGQQGDNQGRSEPQ